ncbi:hypothetical protein L3X38_036244 [Prunus dulcis]|uniref:Uncharacterized protein n=1 Tax=Prunus dulcis TaxID=3755 RepID=A0AAD4YNE1_PRUDU|nr:hypothetical protein L3X38_036244 [Prunus dulcis]
MLWAARQGMACQAAHVKLPIASLSKCLAMPRQDMPRQGMPRPRHAKATARRGMPTQGKACCHVKLPIASLSKCLAMPRPSQGKTCQGQGMPRPRHAEACQRKARHAKAHAKARQGMPRPRQGMPRPRHAKAKHDMPSQGMQAHAMPMPRHDMPKQSKARHANATPCQASNSLTFSKCLEWGNANGKPRPRQGMPRPRHDMPTQAKARHAKLPIALLSRNALNGAMPRPRPDMPRQGMPRPLHALARHAKATPCQASNSLTFSKWLELNGEQYQGQAKAKHIKAKACEGHDMRRPRHDTPTQGQGMPRPLHANARPRHARQGMPRPTTWQGKARQAEATTRQAKAMTSRR